MKNLINRQHRISVENAIKLNNIQNRITTLSDFEFKLFGVTLFSSGIWFDNPQSINYHKGNSNASDMLDDNASLIPTAMRFTLLEIEMRFTLRNCKQLSPSRFKEFWGRIWIKNHTSFETMRLRFWKAQFNILSIEKEPKVITRRKHSPSHWMGEWVEFCQTNLSFKFF